MDSRAIHQPRNVPRSRRVLVNHHQFWLEVLKPPATIVPLVSNGTSSQECNSREKNLNFAFNVDNDKLVLKYLVDVIFLFAS